MGLPSTLRGLGETAGAMRPSLAPDTVLRDTYVVLRLIGRGGMGEVYEVRHLRLAGRYALKVLRPEVSRDDDLLARFRREAHITSALHHPNIVQVIDFDRTAEDCVFLAMEYLQGADLAAVLRREGRLSMGRVRHLMGQVVSALSAAHRRGIVHRDLKPANIFILEDDATASRDTSLESSAGLVKLMDFGLSKWDQTLKDASISVSREQSLIGTPRYMAPEQAQGRNRDVTAATDQFALAAITYEMLTGVSPFRGETLAEVLHAIIFENPAPLLSLRPDVPAPAAQAIERALAKAPDKRFPSVNEFWRQLERSYELAMATTRATPTSLRATTMSPGLLRITSGRGRTARRWWAVAATIALLSGGGLLARYLGRPLVAAEQPEAANPPSVDRALLPQLPAPRALPPERTDADGGAPTAHENVTPSLRLTPRPSGRRQRAAKSIAPEPGTTSGGSTSASAETRTSPPDAGPPRRLPDLIESL